MLAIEDRDASQPQMIVPYSEDFETAVAAAGSGLQDQVKALRSMMKFRSQQQIKQERERLDELRKKCVEDCKSSADVFSIDLPKDVSFRRVPSQQM